MIVLFHENVLLLSTYKFIAIHRNFGAFVYESVEKQMLTAIALVIKQHSIVMPCEGDITFRTPARIYF